MYNAVQDNSFDHIHGGLFSNNSLTVNYISPSVHVSLGRTRGYMPAANDKLFGRDQEIEDIVRILTTEPADSDSKRARFALLGAGGQGKSALAAKVMAQPAVKRCYSAKNSLWIPCDGATSAELLLDVLVTSFDIPKDTHNTIQDILAELQQSSEPILLLLDNFETPWNAAGARGAVSRILRDLAQFPHVALFITMRGHAAPCEEITWVERRIQPLDPDSSRQLYITVDKKAKEDEKLAELLEMLGHMPLAVKLMARHGKNTGYTARELSSRYSLAMLGPTNSSDPQNSVSISISMSLESSLVKDELNAITLLSIIATLPSGVSPESLSKWWAPELRNGEGALRALLEASLLEREASSYFVLPVIRSYVLHPSRISTPVRDSMVKAACHFLKVHDSFNPGQPFYTRDMIARSSEEINLQAILLGTSAPDTDSIQALYTLACHQYRSRPRTEVIEHAVKLATDATDHNVVGRVLDCYGWMLYDLNRFDEALERYNQAREAYLTASEPRLAALILLDIALTAPLVDSQTDEISFIDQAREELETIYSSPDASHNQRHFLHSFSSIRNRFRKGASVKRKDDSTLYDGDMAKCLWRLGSAHSRRGNYSEAIALITKARCLFTKASRARAQCAFSLSEAYHRLQRHDEAEQWGLMALKEGQALDKNQIDPVLWMLGVIHISKGQYDQAIEYLCQGLESAKARDSHLLVATLSIELGRAYMKKGQTEVARSCFTEASTRFRRLQGRLRQMIICKFYLETLEDPLRVPTEKEKRALRVTAHAEDIPP
ncbi:hypothetical protein C8J56DRAFT_819580 [Mycena floridula]|nr:hypothetical protein C8J56DRAFT_819580 [Mycena floridula]